MAIERSIRAVAVLKDPPTLTERSVRAVAVYQDPPRIQVRNVLGYAWSAAPVKTQVRNVQGYAWQPATKTIAKSLTSAAALLQLINQNTIKTFAAADLSFAAPGAYSDAFGNDTKVRITAKNSSGYSGSTDVYYRRQSLTKAFDGTLALTAPGVDTTVYGFLATINASFGTAFTTDDLVDGPIKTGATGLVLTAKSTSLLWVPGSQAYAGIVAGLSTAVATRNLLGFDNAAGVGPKTTYTVLLMHFDGANGQTTTKDEMGHTVTLTGGAALTTSYAKFGTSSLNASTSGSACTIPDAPELRFPAGQDFTIEFFSYLTKTSGDYCFLVKGARSFIELYNGALQMGLDGSTPGQNLFSGIQGLTTGVQQHIAFTRQGTTWRVFIGGVLKATATSSGAFGATTAPLSIGGGGVGTTNNLPGYMDELRISKICKYTAGFTPPTSASGPEYYS